jgi:hypothetical protein
LKQSYFQQKKDYRVILDNEKREANSIRIDNSKNKSQEAWNIVRENTTKFSFSKRIKYEQVSEYKSGTTID